VSITNLSPTVPAEIEPATYTVPDFARLMQCSARHIWRQIDLGRVPGIIRCGRLVRISKHIADAWIADGCPSSRGTGR
jgi:hypothetical protein